jgi:hypothetical protein
VRTSTIILYPHSAAPMSLDAIHSTIVPRDGPE